MGPDLGACPVCDTEIAGKRCSECDAALDVLFDARRLAWVFATEAANLVREERIDEAAEHVADAVLLFPTDKIRELAGWIEFLRGEPCCAARMWKEVPQSARRVVEAFNEALSRARVGDWKESIRQLDTIHMHFLPALRLRWVGQVVEGRSADAAVTRGQIQRAFPGSVSTLPPPEGKPDFGARAESPSDRRRSIPLLLYVAGAVLVGGIVGAGVMSIWDEDPSGAGSEAVSPPVEEGLATGRDADSASRGEEPDSSSLRSLALSILQGDPTSLSGAGEVGSEPLDSLFVLPTETRRSLSRGWYLRGIASSDEEASDSKAWLEGSVMLVGASAGDYWVDDALYALMQMEWQDGNRNQARRLGELIRAHHGGGMFNNSVLQSIVEPEEDL